MKLVYCRKCDDVVRLVPDSTRYCSCGVCWGHYTGQLDAEYGGEGAIPFVILNGSFIEAIHSQPPYGDGSLFTAAVIPVECPTMKKADAPDNRILLEKEGR